MGKSAVESNKDKQENERKKITGEEWVWKTGDVQKKPIKNIKGGDRDRENGSWRRRHNKRARLWWDYEGQCLYLRLFVLM